MLITLFTSNPVSRTEPDLGLFPLGGDEVFFLARKGSTHGYSLFFQVSPLKNKVMDTSSDRNTGPSQDIICQKCPLGNTVKEEKSDAVIW